MLRGVGRLQKTDGSRVWLLGSHDLIGRSRACTIRLDDPEVSGEHAVLRWTGACWNVKDLHSRNGVHVDGRRLAPGIPTALAAGSVLGFGRVGGYTLVDAGEPIAFAVPQGDGEPSVPSVPTAPGVPSVPSVPSMPSMPSAPSAPTVPSAPSTPIMAVGGILALPDPDAPAVTIFRVGPRWSMDKAGEVGPIADGETVRIGATMFRVHLPEALPPTANAAASAPQLNDLRLRFSVSRDEEYVELIAVHGDRVFDLQARRHHYVLLLLARARQRQRERPLAGQGWVHQHVLLEQLRVDRNQLHLDIFRARRQLGEAGVADAARIVERRSNTSQLRIGVPHLEIAANDDDAPGQVDPRRRAPRPPR